MASIAKARLIVALVACSVIGAFVPTGGIPSASASHASPAMAALFHLQWNLRAINAPRAWSDGRFGSSDVRVAILDTGIDSTHPDLIGRVDLDDSISLVPEHPRACKEGEPGAPSVGGDNGEYARALADPRPLFHDYHGHGTAVAGLVASNGHALAGVTRDTTLIAIKVHDRGRRNCLGVYLDGIYKAVERNADVIHLSFPLEFSADQFPDAVEDVRQAMSHAHANGAVLVAAAGNAADDLDADPSQFRFCEAVHVICLSSTGPATPTGVDYDTPAQFTNFGRDIDVSGPGGSGIVNAGVITPIVQVPLVCSQATLGRIPPTGNPQILPAGRPCSADGVSWRSVGTSFAAAATSGLAALLVSIVGHDDPGRIAALIRASAVDLGAPGNDPIFGKGRIDVAAAVAKAIALE